MSSKEKKVWAIRAAFVLWRDDDNGTKHILAKKPQINPFVIKSVLETNFNPIRKIVKKENLN